MYTATYLGLPGYLAGMDKPGVDSNFPGRDNKFLPRDQASTQSWRSPGSQAGSLAEISTPSRDPDTNLSPAQTSATYWVATWLIDHAMPCHALNVYSIHKIFLFNLTWTSHLDRYEENVLMAYSLILSCGFDSRENTTSWSFELINSGIPSNSSLPN